MIYSVGSMPVATQNFGAYQGKGSKAKRYTRRVKCHIEDTIEGLGKQVNMNRYKQINKAKIEQKQLGTQPVFFSPYTPTGNVNRFVK